MIKKSNQNEWHNARIIIFGIIGIIALLFMGVFIMKFIILDSIVHTIMATCKVTTCEIWSCQLPIGTACALTKLQYQTMMISSNPKQLLIGNTTVSHLNELDNSCAPIINVTQCKFVVGCIDDVANIICYYHDLYPTETISVEKPLMPIYGIWIFVSVCITMSILMVATGTMICNSCNLRDYSKKSKSIKMQFKNESPEAMNLLDDASGSEKINIVNATFTDEHL